MILNTNRTIIDYYNINDAEKEIGSQPPTCQVWRSWRKQ